MMYCCYFLPNSLQCSQTLFAPEQRNITDANNNVATETLAFGINGSLRKREVQAQASYTEYYLFNSAANLKAYSNNGLDFAYYGYNASNARTYKLSMQNMGQWVNGQPQPIHLQIQQAMFYPNAYVNFNQNGEYTKHYYNGAERIASRLGTVTLNNATTSNSRLDTRSTQLENCFRNDIRTLVYAGDIPMDMPPEPVSATSLQQTGTSSDIFYYHTNHLGSTAFVTDNNATITQGFLYAPFGEITTEYAPLWQNGTLPKYSFNAKELDEETGMYYYEARYYKPPVFISRDRLFEKYPWMSPYGYCMNNPIKFVDPSGDSVAILLAGKAVLGNGHMAILIQEKTDNGEYKWFLYSKNGDDDGNLKRVSGSESGTSDDEHYGGRVENGYGQGFSSVQEFLDQHKENTVQHDGKGGTYYTEAYVLPTTPEQDLIIKNGMKQKLKENYHFTGSNCSQAVVCSLNKAGVQTYKDVMSSKLTPLGRILLNTDYNYQFTKYLSENVIPITMYNNIKTANTNGKVVIPNTIW